MNKPALDKIQLMNLAAFKDLTRIEQTLFNLPLVLAGALLTYTQCDVTLNFRIFWIFPAFLLARISGMAFNQLIDRHIDAKNPRTQNRTLPSGRVSEKQARLIAWGALVLFLLVCFQINTLCFLLAPVVALLLFSYSYLKRFTTACHFVLGLIFGLGPLMASIAVSGTILVPALWLGFAAALSITGSDAVYAIQDFEFDRNHCLFSLPSKLGIEKSLQFSRLLHFLCVIALALVGFTGHLPVFYYALVPLSAGIFYRFHSKISEKPTEPLFFSCNVQIAFTIFGFILASVIWDVM